MQLSIRRAFKSTTLLIIILIKVYWKRLLSPLFLPPESRAEKVSPDTAKFSWPLHLCPSMWEYHFEGSEWAKQVVDACVIPLGLAHFFKWGLKTSILENLCGPATGSLKWWWPMAFHMQIHMRHMHAWISGEQAFQHDSTGKKLSKMLISGPIPARSLWEMPRPAATWNGPTLSVSQKLKRETKSAVCLLDTLFKQMQYYRTQRNGKSGNIYVFLWAGHWMSLM